MSESKQLLQNITSFWERHQLLKDITVVVGVSGGVDSQVLLHSLIVLRSLLNIRIHVATLDHGLRGQAGAEDAAYVEQLAQAWNVPCTREYIDVNEYIEDYDLNIEEAARQARYSFLLDVANRVDATYIAAGHNHDDQAETILMHIIRGTGLAGLRGILPVTALTDFHLLDYELNEDLDYLPEDFVLIRPLLDTPRRLIQLYADENNLKPRIDETNDDLARFRNTLRHDILPQLETLNPNIKWTLSRMADVVAAEVEVLDSRLESVAAWMVEWDETVPTDDEIDGGELAYLDREAFLLQPLAIQRGLLRKIVFDLMPDARDLSFELTETARELIAKGQTGAHLDFPDGLYLQMGYDEVMIAYGGIPYYPPSLPSLRPGQQVDVDIDGQGMINEKQRLVMYWVVERLSKDFHPTDPLECTLAVPENADIEVRTRREGDRFKPFGLGGKSQKINDTFTNLKVPAYYRDQVPLFVINGEVAWFVVPTATGPVGRISNEFAVRPEKQSILRVRWQMMNNPINNDA